MDMVEYLVACRPFYSITCIRRARATVMSSPFPLFRRLLLVAPLLSVTCVSLRAAGADKVFKGNVGGNGNASNPDNYTNTNNGNTSNR